MFKALALCASIPAAMATVIWATTAAAQQRPQCGPHQKVVEGLAKRYDQTPQMMGLDRKGMVLQIFANPETGSWTAVLTNPAGTSCLVSAGEAFRLIQAKPAGTDG